MFRSNEENFDDQNDLSLFDCKKLVKEIGLYLDNKSLARASQVCKFFQEATAIELQNRKDIFMLIKSSINSVKDDMNKYANNLRKIRQEIIHPASVDHENFQLNSRSTHNLSNVIFSIIYYEKMGINFFDEAVDKKDCTHYIFFPQLQSCLETYYALYSQLPGNFNTIQDLIQKMEKDVDELISSEIHDAQPAATANPTL